MDQPSTTRLQISLSQEVLKVLSQRAHAEGRSLSSLASDLLCRYLREQPQR